jgi:hypothetical protein
MLYSGKMVQEKLEHSIKVAVLALAQYLEALDQPVDPIKLITQNINTPLWLQSAQYSSI